MPTDNVGERGENKGGWIFLCLQYAFLVIMQHNCKFCRQDFIFLKDSIHTSCNSKTERNRSKKKTIPVIFFLQKICVFIFWIVPKGMKHFVFGKEGTSWSRICIWKCMRGPPVVVRINVQRISIIMAFEWKCTSNVFVCNRNGYRY